MSADKDEQLSTAIEAVARDAALGPCSHHRSVPVDLALTGETVAALCVDCHTQLPTSWLCDDCEKLEVTTFSSPVPERMPGQRCVRHGGVE